MKTELMRERNRPGGTCLSSVLVSSPWAKLIETGCFASGICYTEFMKYKCIALLVVSMFNLGCGDSRTSAQLRSPDQIKAVTDTFVVGQTKISDVESALGLWNSQGKTNWIPGTLGYTEYVSYWTNDGGQTTITFGSECLNEVPVIHVPGCFSAVDHSQ
jgi:hypothetical protein